jgi:tryptophan synthase alpha chain
MNRIEAAFAEKKAFIPFITAGDPNLDITERLVIEMAAAGADLIELGIPFSDPVAEGVVIQKADERALNAGTTTDKIFDMVRRVRTRCDVPLAFMTYANPVFVYGLDRFLKNCAEVGIDALIVPDLPFEEKEEFLPYCSAHGVALISLIAPTSSERIAAIAKDAQGFVYCVSSLGVTGVRDTITTDLSQMVAQVKKQKDIPCAIGFGISNPEQARQMAQIADGVIVGSAIVRLVEQYKEACIDPVCDYVRSIKTAIQDL